MNSTPNARCARIIMHSPGDTVYPYFVTGRFCRERPNLLGNLVATGYIVAAYKVAGIALSDYTKTIARQQIACPSDNKSLRSFLF